MSDELTTFTEAPKAAKRPETSEVKKALDAAKLADKREALRKRAELGQAIGKACKDKRSIQQSDFKR